MTTFEHVPDPPINLPALPVLDVDAPAEDDGPDLVERLAANGRRAWRRAKPRIVNRLRLLRHRTYRGLLLVLKLAFVYSPRGFGRLVARFSKWVYDWDSAVRRHEASEVGDAAKAQGMRKANLKARLLVTSLFGLPPAFFILAWVSPLTLGILCGVTLALWVIQIIPGKHWGEHVAAAALGGLVIWQLPPRADAIPAPPWQAFVAFGVVAIIVLGVIGRPTHKPALNPGVLPANVVPPLRAPMVTAALCTLGNSRMTAKTEDDPEGKPLSKIQLLMDVARQGPGYQIDLELPAGVPASFVQGRREAFAAALRRELGTVWPSVGARHPGHLSLYVCDLPMSRAPQEPWPLLESGVVDLGARVPLFTDQRGDWVSIRLAYANMIIGAVPRMGKTFALRQCLLTAGLDKRAKVYAYDGKGTGDLASCRHFAHSYVRGARLDKPELIDAVRGDIKELRQELGRRADVIDSLPPEECPENKVTSELIDARPDLDLGWIVVGIDETQMYFSYGDDDDKEHKKIRAELKAGVTELVKLGPALGIIVILATQQVNRDTIPTSISNNAVLRFCLKIEGQDPNDRILGTGAYKRGYDAQMFDLEEDKGIGYLKGDGARAQIVRSVFGLDGEIAEQLGMRARRLRLAAGLLTGDAAGEAHAVPEPQANLLDDCCEVVTEAGGHNMSLDTLRDRLGLLRPGIYGHLDNAALGGLLRGAGVEPGAVWCPLEKETRKGVKLEWITGQSAPGTA